MFEIFDFQLVTSGGGRLSWPSAFSSAQVSGKRVVARRPVPPGRPAPIGGDVIPFFTQALVLPPGQDGPAGDTGPTSGDNLPPFIEPGVA